MKNIKPPEDWSPEMQELYRKEMELDFEHYIEPDFDFFKDKIPNLYSMTDMEVFNQSPYPKLPYYSTLKTLDELLENDKKREADGFPKRIRIGKIIKPTKGEEGKVVVVPTTTEPKFYHDDSITEEEQTGGSGEGEEGEVIGEQKAKPEEGEGEGQGAGEGKGSDHDMISDAFDLGKVLTEQFQLPNLKDKGTKRSFTKYKYDLTDKNRGFGQLLDKKATMKKIIETNILLGNIKRDEPFNPDELILNPKDEIYRIMSREKDFEAQAMVFFLRDYSGSMHGKPTEVVVKQHLLIYSWLMYQYQNNVKTRFIVHDTEAKEVPDFYTYYKYQVAGGTQVYPAFEMVNKIVEEENLAKDYNIYVFHGTDGDDWEQKGTRMIAEIKEMFNYISRLGITVAKNSWSRGSRKTTVEQNIDNSELLKKHPELIRIDSMIAAEATENRIIEGIRKIIS